MWDLRFGCASPLKAAVGNSYSPEGDLCFSREVFTMMLPTGRGENRARVREVHDPGNASDLMLHPLKDTRSYRSPHGGSGCRETLTCTMLLCLSKLLRKNRSEEEKGPRRTHLLDPLCKAGQFKAFHRLFTVLSRSCFNPLLQWYINQPLETQASDKLICR